jgi:hypothetical protein
MLLLSSRHAGQGIQAAYRENHHQEDTSMLEDLEQFGSSKSKSGRLRMIPADIFFWFGLNHTMVLTVIAKGK